MFKYRSQRIALTISVMIHLLVLVLYRPLARMHLFPAQTGAARADTPEPLVFDLVETPDDAIRQRPENARLLSDKNAIARDQYRGEDKDMGEAYSEGEVQYRVFAGKSGSDPASQDPSREMQARKVPDESRERAQNENRSRLSEDLDSRLRQIPPMKIESKPQSEAGSYSSLSLRQFIDDLNFDQRRSHAGNFGGITLNTYNWNFASYILDMKKKLKASTFPPAAFTLLGMISGKTVINFKVFPDGKAADINVVEYEGDRSLMETSVDAVRVASPFSPLPRDFPEEYLELTWTFIYYVYR